MPSFPKSIQQIPTNVAKLKLFHDLCVLLDQHRLKLILTILINVLKVRAVLQREADFEPHTLASSKCNIYDTLSGKKGIGF